MLDSNCALFDVIAFDASGSQLETLSERIRLTGALACARGYNLGNRSSVAVVVPVSPADVAESMLPELALFNLCQTRAEETHDTCTVWDALYEYCDEDADLSEAEATLHRLLRLALAERGESLPAAGDVEDDALSLCERLPVDAQLTIWQQLRSSF